ncbi:MAG: tRNA (adenosine(37)-N6)-threonylcarbamoyltransferase complex dimerization subunit type 1 TsaB [Minicystis sp.]
MKLLALSTTTPRGSAAVLVPGLPPFAASYVDLQGHAERIFHAIDEALALAGLGRGDLEALACDIGPGSFTGVRVGVASAKGIALALGLPLIGVVSLAAMAAAAFAEGGAEAGDVVLAAIDAKKNEIFRAVYARAAQGELVEILAPACAPPSMEDPAITGEPRRLRYVGEVLASIAPAPSGLLRGPSLDLPDAAWIGRLALVRLAVGDHGDPAQVEPLYVREADAKPMVLPAKADPGGDIG